jgi:hypothetical protein
MQSFLSVDLLISGKGSTKNEKTDAELNAEAQAYDESPDGGSSDESDIRVGNPAL